MATTIASLMDKSGNSRDIAPKKMNHDITFSVTGKATGSATASDLSGSNVAIQITAITCTTSELTGKLAESHFQDNTIALSKLKTEAYESTPSSGSSKLITSGAVYTVDKNAVHKSENETINGNKSFSNDVIVAGTVTANAASLGDTGITGNLGVSGDCGVSGTLTANKANLGNTGVTGTLSTSGAATFGGRTTCTDRIVADTGADSTSNEGFEFGNSYRYFKLVVMNGQLQLVEDSASEKGRSNSPASAKVIIKSSGTGDSTTYQFNGNATTATTAKSCTGLVDKAYRDHFGNIISNNYMTRGVNEPKLLTTTAMRSAVAFKTITTYSVSAGTLGSEWGCTGDGSSVQNGLGCVYYDIVVMLMCTDVPSSSDANAYINVKLEDEAGDLGTLFNVDMPLSGNDTLIIPIKLYIPATVAIYRTKITIRGYYTSGTTGKYAARLYGSYMSLGRYGGLVPWNPHT